MAKLRLGRYDFTICLTFGAYAMVSIIIPMVLVPLAASLDFPLDDGGMGRGGALQLGRSVPMVLSMLVCGFAAGIWGKRRSLGFATLLMSLGLIICALSPSYAILFTALALSGLGEGVVEGLATPFVQDLHPEEPGRYLNITHAFWSVGVVTLTLVAGYLLLQGVGWRSLVLAVGLLPLIPTVAFLWPNPAMREYDQRDKTHWREVCHDTWEIMRQRRFWLFFATMFFAGGAEFCLTFWVASFIQLEYAGSALLAGAGTALFAAGMFIGRIGSGYLVSQNNLLKLVLWMSLAGVFLTLLLPLALTLAVLFPLLFLSGIATSTLWPSLQSIGALSVKGDNTMMMIMFSCSGVPGCGFFAALMGSMGDWLGLRLSFALVPACFLVLFLLLGYAYLTESREAQPGK